MCVLKLALFPETQCHGICNGQSIYMRAFLLQIAKLSACANILKGAGLAFFHLQDDFGFLENKMSL